VISDYGYIYYKHRYVRSKISSATLLRISDLNWMDGLGQRGYRSWIMQFVYTTILLCVQQLMAFWSNETTVTQFKYIPLPSAYKADEFTLGIFKYVLYYFYIFSIYLKIMLVWDLKLPQSLCCRFAYSGIFFEWKLVIYFSKKHNAFLFRFECFRKVTEVSTN
jgi:hypothetical protein